MVDVLTLAEISVFLLFAYGIFSQIAGVLKKRASSFASYERKYGSSGRVAIGASIEELLNNAPQITAQLEKLWLEQSKKGATPEMLKPIEDRMNMVKTAQQWEIPLRIAAPVLDRLGERAIRLAERLLG